MNICVFGAASPKVDRQYIEAAEMLGEQLAKRGHNLVFGGGAHGLMGAVARGNKVAGGKVCGVVPQFFLEEDIEPIFEYCDELIITKDMAERKDKMEELSDAFIIAPGGIGTFEEFFQMLVLKQLDRHKKPMAIYNVNGYYFGIEALMHTGAEEEFLRENTLKLYKAFDGDEMEEMLDYIENDHSTEGLHVRDLKYM
ncbi:MAG: TIGR00730 family Rossman fold protein [Parasporobacterium sp.]|nr:TIGR00730 family Rossman fold protein [Parasporobacterium sp.]